MGEFHFYKFTFLQQSEGNLFSVAEGQTLDDTLHAQRLESALTSASQTPSQHIDLRDLGPNEDGTAERYYNRVVRCYQDVTLWRVHKHKILSVISYDSAIEQSIDSYPYCWVIVVPRANAVLVERKTEAFSSTSQVANLIKDWVIRELCPIESRWTFTMEQRHCLGNIWDVVRDRTIQRRDRLVSIKVMFNEPRPNPQCEVDELVQRFLSVFASVKGELMLQANDTTRQLFMEENENLVQFVNLLVTNQYQLRMRFKRTGTIDYGKNAVATYGIPAEQIDSFGAQSAFNPDDGSTTCDLVTTLQSILPDNADYIYTPLKPRKHRNGHAGAVS